MYGKGALLRAITEGLYAQRKLAGDSDILIRDDPEFINAVIAQGKRAEGTCRREGYFRTIEGAYHRAKLPLPENYKDASEETC